MLIPQLHQDTPTPKVKLLAVTLAAILSGCGGGVGTGSLPVVTSQDPLPVTLSCTAPEELNAAGDTCVTPPPPPIQCDAPLVPNETLDACVNPAPVMLAGDNQAVIYYYRADGDYDNWKLHAWNNDACDAYTEEFVADITWDNGAANGGIDSNYGAYYLLPLKADFGSCANFILHNGGEKDPDDNDQQLDLSADRWSFILSGIGSFTTPTLATDDLPLNAQGASAHWLDEKTLLLNVEAATASVKLLHSATAGLEQLSSDMATGENAIALQSTTLSAEQQALVPHLQDWVAYTHSLSTDEVKTLLTEQLLVASFGAEDQIQAGTYVQAAKVLDDLYTKGDNDADEATLGATYQDDGSIATAVWAPTAQSVALKLYGADKSLTATQEMTLDTQTGIWSANVEASFDRAWYRYEVTAYHPLTKAIEVTEATDPYSVNLSVNGRYSQFVNLSDADLKPTGWDGHAVPTIAALEDAVIYEAHIRDFSVLDQSTSAANRGKYLAFTEQDSAPVQHLKSLVAAGLTHFHLLPVNDMGTINEDEANQRVDLNNTVGQLCAVNANAPVCGVQDDAAVLLDVMKNYDPSTGDAQALVESMRGLDGFNWGYDPHHFNVPEGSYASNAEGVSRIVETRAMIQSLHQMGLRSVLDVVYNHTASSGLFDNSVFDKVVPGYYHRYNETNGQIERSTCCENTASEHRMFGKYVTDSLVLWADEYGFDGFRFDVMGHMPKQLILDSRTAVQQVDADTYFYGEGWNFGEVSSDRLFEQATQENIAGSEIGTFNDRPRDTIRDGALFKEAVDLTNIDHIRLGLAGTLKDYMMVDEHGNAKVGSSYGQASYADDPADIINYVSKHDNRTLWDQLQYGLPESMTLASRVRAQNIAASIPLLSQGIPFFQMGGDMLRSKSEDKNSYDAGDWFNRVDFTMGSNGWNSGLPLAQDNQGEWEQISNMIANLDAAPATADIAFAAGIFSEMLSIRSGSKLFRLTSGDDAINRVGFHNTGPEQTAGLIVMSIDDGTDLVDLDPANDAIVVIINGSNSAQTHSINTAAGFELHSVLQNSMDETVKSSSFAADGGVGTFSVPALTTAIFVKPQGDAQGEGLAANPNAVAIPYGDTEIFVRGINTWDAVNKMEYAGEGIYSFTTTLAAGDYEFKIADANWAEVNLGYNEVTFAVDSIAVSDVGGNMALTLDAAASYKFSVNASLATPQVSITVANQIIACDALPNSADPYPLTVAGGGKLYVKGSHSGWGADEAYVFNYKGENRYQAVAHFDGDMQFKFASDDGDWTTQLWAANSDATAIETANLVLDESHTLALGNAGTDNNQASLSAGTYSFLLTLDEANPAESLDVGSLVIQQCAE
ncbi:MAG: pullulanase [Phenylobacterium sp.]|jgi:pullulanase